MRDLNEIIAANKANYSNHTSRVTTITTDQLQEIRRALCTAKASLKDVLQHGAGPRQRLNINGQDLPLLDNACYTVDGLRQQLPAYGVVPLDKPMRGADSLYAEERAEARFDAIEDARQAAVAAVRAQEIEDAKVPATPTAAPAQSLCLNCHVVSGDRAVLEKAKFYGGELWLKVMEDNSTTHTPILLHQPALDQLARWLDGFLTGVPGGVCIPVGQGRYVTASRSSNNLFYLNVAQRHGSLLSIALRAADARNLAAFIAMHLDYAKS